MTSNDNYQKSEEQKISKLNRSIKMISAYKKNNKKNKSRE